MRGRSLHYFVIDGHQVEQHLPEIWRLYHHVNEVVNKTCGRALMPLENRRVGANVNIEENLDTYLYTEQASASSDPNYA